MAGHDVNAERAGGEPVGAGRRRWPWPAGGIGLAWAWYLVDRAGYDAVRGTALATLLDRVWWLAFWPVNRLWRGLEGTGIVPLGDYAWDFILYRAMQGLWLTAVGAGLGLLAGLLWRAARPGRGDQR